jgi:hypothetical protein
VDVVRLQNISFILIFSLMIIIPVYLILKYRKDSKGQNERHERELREIIKQMDKKN